MIFDSKRALAKDVAQRENKALLAIHPKFEELLKTRKSVEISLVKAKNKGEDISQLQAQLEELNIQIKIYAEENQLVFMPKYSCSICKDEGYVAGEPCECLTKEYNALLREHCALAPLNGFSFDDNKFTSLTVAQAKGMSKLYSIMQNKVCNNFDDCKWQNFMLAGSSGVGKTCLATATANALLNSNVSVLYLSAFELVNVFLDKHTHKSTALSKMFDYVTACEMLIIDNFGEEPVYKNVTLEYLYQVINERNTSGKLTLITTNLTPERLLSRYGERIYSRLFDKSLSFATYLKANDIRKAF